MADLRTDYKDDILDTSENTKRKYNMINNDDGTVSFEDVTTYLQNGDEFSANILNQIIAKFGGLSFVAMSEAEFDKLENPDKNTVYLQSEE